MSNFFEKSINNRPKIHFAPQQGWLNDPNGLIYVNGKWLIFHQYNPHDTKWGDMHWAATETEDFISWKDKGVAMAPDEEGTIYSGCAILDKAGLAGYGGDKVLYYYTAAGGRSELSKGKPFVQKLAYSNLDGDAVIKTGETVVPYIEAETRDPKVFYHQPSQAYIMILHIKKGCFAIYRSKDLRTWEKSQEINDGVMNECPDLFRVKQDKGEAECWVLWSAQGCYYLGDFDGYRFDKKSQCQKAYIPLPDLADFDQVGPYAAQTFANTGDKVIQMAWIRCNTAHKGYNGQLSLPVEVTLSEDANRLRFCPYEIGKSSAQMVQEIKGNKVQQNICNVNNVAYKLRFVFQTMSTGEIKLQILDETIEILWEEKKIIIDDNELSFDGQEQVDITVFVDTDVLEIFALDGRCYDIIANRKQELNGEVKVSSTENTDGVVEVSELNSIEIEKVK